MKGQQKMRFWLTFSSTSTGLEDRLCYHKTCAAWQGDPISLTSRGLRFWQRRRLAMNHQYENKDAKI